MATKKKSEPAGEPQPKGKKTERLNIWLTPEQIAWLKKDRDGASAAVRALISEAVAMENLAKSVKKGKK
jgi:hypothetical protein